MAATAAIGTKRNGTSLRGFHLVNRRLHLYLALALVPWFLMYGITALPFAHRDWFAGLERTDQPEWTLLLDRPYEIEVPPGQKAKREAGGQILRDLGIHYPSFGAYQPDPAHLQVFAHDFWGSTRVTYLIGEKRVKAEKRWFQWNEFLTGMHARGGFEQDGLLPDLWAATVDLTVFGMLLWVVTGVVMWWRIQSARWWGAAALAGGAGLFALMMFAL